MYDSLSKADHYHLQFSAKAVNEVVPSAVHAVEDEEDVEDDDEEAEHDLHTGGQLEELDTTKVSDCHLKFNICNRQSANMLRKVINTSSVLCISLL